MNEKKDFEAIGRYVDASERVSSLSSRRHNLANDISRLLKKAAIFNDHHNADTVNVFNHAEVVKKADELADINVELETAISEMNSYAAPANKKPVHRT